MRGDPVVIDLMRRADAGDQGAWDQLVERYAPRAEVRVAAE